MINLNVVKHSMIKSIERAGRARLLQELRLLSKRQLVDCGFDPELLKGGLAYWPWRAISETPTTQVRLKLAPQNTAVESSVVEENTHRRAA